jgi:hypothetical protein
MAKLKGSTIYAWGDTNANHGPYTVTLDSNPPVTLNSVTGCGLPYEVKGLCERTEPGLVYFQSYLAPGNHTIKIENVPGANGSFFGALDYHIEICSQLTLGLCASGIGRPESNHILYTILVFHFIQLVDTLAERVHIAHKLTEALEQRFQNVGYAQPRGWQPRHCDILTGAFLHLDHHFHALRPLLIVYHKYAFVLL